MRPTINFTFNSHLTMPLWDHKVRQDQKKKKNETRRHNNGDTKR